VFQHHFAPFPPAEHPPLPPKTNRAPSVLPPRSQGLPPRPQAQKHPGQLGLQAQDLRLWARAAGVQRHADDGLLDGLRGHAVVQVGVSFGGWGGVSDHEGVCVTESRRAGEKKGKQQSLLLQLQLNDSPNVAHPTPPGPPSFAAPFLPSTRRRSTPGRSAAYSQR
jgi:hypothetical protein